MKLNCNLIVVFAALLTISNAQLGRVLPARWCVTTEAEQMKCKHFSEKLKLVRNRVNLDMSTVHLHYKNQTQNGWVRDFQSMPEIQCVEAIDVFDCMTKMDNNEVDLLTLEAGQGYFAGRYHTMRPILAEKYDIGTDTPLEYFSVAIKKAGTPITIDRLAMTKACIPGIGTGAGWVYPISFLLQTKMMQVSECNAVVKTVTDFFSQLCLPGALNSFYNPFGNNPTKVCELCRGSGEQKCTSSDPHANFGGAMRCLDSDGDVAFVRHDTVATNRPMDMDKYELVCPDTTSRPLDQYETCHFGKVPNDIIMTSNFKEDYEIENLKRMLLQASDWFGPGKTYVKDFPMFSSLDYQYLGRDNVLFNDNTKSLVDVGARDRYYTWIDDSFRAALNNLNVCPVSVARLCVVSDAEQDKCMQMAEVFQGKDIKPDLDCLLGTSTQDCMKLVAAGNADLLVLDAGDVYKGGREYDLVPIAAEDYGDMTHSYKVVAAARKADLRMTLFNLKTYRSCQAGIGRGDGWIIPLNIYIETMQFIPQQCTIFENIGQLFTRSCIPGALDKDYNPNQNPINLCEGCAGGSYRKCARTSDEQYYGVTGAFRCLVEKAGDVAFVHHLTVGDNTDGRNQAIWARNRRSDDYELLCKDGTRKGIDDWATCYLGTVPGAAMVTASFKEQNEREIYWNMFSYGQQFFSSDIDGDFHLFDSGLFYQDLIFSDEAVRLVPIEPEMQDYKSYLGYDFISQIRNLDHYMCVPAASSASTLSATLVTLSAVIFSLVLAL